ncbi:PRD domain-containing protein [Enterococcus viikkiensis]|uniref:PRD domain-containing protein n=1 Tax=Enterococcus viikkiensis TaxID=930854 RepID=UPI0010F643CC|nr:PRD domain-containing protein [Enterococcus viikkiensis]
MSGEAREIILTSEYQTELQGLVDWLIEKLAAVSIVPTELQWTILVNHLNEMLRRSKTDDTIPEIDPLMFSEVSSEALNLADGVVKKIDNLTKDEIYVLSIHFETAKQN